MIIAMLNPEKIWHEHLTDLSTAPVKYSHFTLEIWKKSTNVYDVYVNFFQNFGYRKLLKWVNFDIVIHEIIR